MTSTITIYRTDGSALATVTFDTDSYRREQVMGEHAVTLNFSLPQPDNGISQSFIDIPVGSHITFKGQRYTLYNPSNFTKNGNRNYAYTLKLEAYQATMADSIFINIPDGRTSFTRTARPHEFLESLVDNLNREDSGWTVGAYIEAVPTTIAFNETPCSESLRLIAEAFKTEWEVKGKEISLRKVEYFKNAPLTLQYGQGNGFTQGLGRGNFDNSRPINRLFVRGGERNIDYSTYGSQTLLLPSGQTMAYDGTYFQDEAGFNSAIARTYAVSGDGRSFIRTDVPAKSKREGSVELTDIYPMREGTVTQVLWYYKEAEYTSYSTALAAAMTDGSDAGSVFCDIFDNTIPENLDYSSTRLDGEQMMVVFQTGMLAGREIGVQQDENSVTGYVHVDPSDPTKNRRFKLITEFTDGFPMPGGNFSPVVGDKYAVFGMKMPDAYVRDDDTKSGASWDLFREAVRYKYENEEYRFTFKGEMNGIWAQENWDAIEDKIVAGGYVQFSDPQFQPAGVLIRISAIKEFLYQPYKPTLELTNVVIGGGVRGELAKIEQQEVVIDDRIKDIATLSNRQWRDELEVKKGLSSLHLGFTEGEMPVWLQTLMVLVGSDQCQFKFVNNRIQAEEVRPVIVYDPTQNTLQVQGGVIQHMTLGIDAMSGVHDLSEYTFWNVDALTTDPLEEDKLYWLYARVPKTGNANGTFVVTTDEMPFDTDSNYYNLLVGALNSEYAGDRAYTSWYGYSSVTPGQLLVNLIRASNPNIFWDLITGKWQTGKFSGNTMIAGITVDPNASDDSVFKMKGAIVQSPSGDEDVIGVFRGNYDPYAVYYKGDEMFHNGSTYRYINDIAQAGIEPPNASHWALRASEGKYTTYVFQSGSSKPARPTSTELIPSGWSAQPPVVGGDSISNPSYSGTGWYDSNGRKHSPVVLSNGISKQRLTFTTSKANSVVNFEIYSSSESGYDFMLIGLPNNPNLSRTANYTDRVSGVDVSKIVSVTFPNAGTNYIEFAYAKDGSSVAGDDYGMYRIVSGGVVWVSLSVVEKNASGEWGAKSWSDPVQWSGTSGKDGNDGRIFSYTGDYDGSKIYTGNSQVAQVVKVGSQYYYTTATSGTFSGVQPPNFNYWTLFGANFESVATDILFAKNGTLGSFAFDFATKEFRSAETDGIPTAKYPNGTPNIVLNSETGEAIFNKIEMGGWHADGYGIVNNFNEDLAYILFRYDPSNVFASIGTNTLPGSSGMRSVARFENGEVNPYGRNIGAYISAKNGGTNSAIYMASGFISGFSVESKQIVSSYTVVHSDCYLSCYNSSSITITLPAPTSMQVGKVIYIRNMTGSAITIKGKIHRNVEYTSVPNNTSGNVAMFVNDGQFWCHNYMES